MVLQGGVTQDQDLSEGTAYGTGGSYVPIYSSSGLGNLMYGIANQAGNGMLSGAISRSAGEMPTSTVSENAAAAGSMPKSSPAPAPNHIPLNPLSFNQKYPDAIATNLNNKTAAYAPKMAVPPAAVPPTPGQMGQMGMLQTATDATNATAPQQEAAPGSPEFYGGIHPTPAMQKLFEQTTGQPYVPTPVPGMSQMPGWLPPGSGAAPPMYGSNNPMLTQDMSQMDPEVAEARKRRKAQIEQLEKELGGMKSPYQSAIDQGLAVGNAYQQRVSAMNPLQRMSWNFKTMHTANPASIAVRATHNAANSPLMRSYKDLRDEKEKQLEVLRDEEMKFLVAHSNQVRSDKFSQMKAQQEELAPLKAAAIKLYDAMPPGPEKAWQMAWDQYAGILPSGGAPIQLSDGTMGSLNSLYQRYDVRGAAKEDMEAREKLNKLKLYPIMEQQKRQVIKNAMQMNAIRGQQAQVRQQLLQANAELQQARAKGYNPMQTAKLAQMALALSHTEQSMAAQAQAMESRQLHDIWFDEKMENDILGNPYRQVTPELKQRVADLKTKGAGIVEKEQALAFPKEVLAKAYGRVQTALSSGSATKAQLDEQLKILHTSVDQLEAKHKSGEI